MQRGLLALDGDGRAVGFVLASCMPDARPADPASTSAAAWVDALAVHPASQRNGIGRALVDWARAWLVSQGAQRAWIGASQRPFAPGLFAELNNRHIFERLGFAAVSREVLDVAADLQTDLALRPIPHECAIAPATSADLPDVLDFMQREFAGRWTYELREHIRELQRPGEFVLLRMAGAVEGFAHITFEDSQRPIERWYMHGLPRPWGQLGAIGVSARLRGSGCGGALLSGGLAHLRAEGVRGCVIDWTNLTDFYAKWGFRKHRQYVMATINLAGL